MRLIVVMAASLVATTANADPVRKAAVKDPNKVICETQEVVGSRLASRRVCMTRAQWDDARQRDRQDIDRGQRIQTNPTG